MLRSFTVHDVCSSVKYVKSTIFVTKSSEGRHKFVVDGKIGPKGRQKVVLDERIGLKGRRKVVLDGKIGLKGHRKAFLDVKIGLRGRRKVVLDGKIGLKGRWKAGPGLRGPRREAPNAAKAPKLRGRIENLLIDILLWDQTYIF